MIAPKCKCEVDKEFICDDGRCLVCEAYWLDEIRYQCDREEFYELTEGDDGSVN